MRKVKLIFVKNVSFAYLKIIIIDGSKILHRYIKYCSHTFTQQSRSHTTSMIYLIFMSYLIFNYYNTYDISYILMLSIILTCKNCVNKFVEYI